MQPSVRVRRETHKEMKARTQILISRAGLKNLVRVNFSGMQSSRSLLMRRMMKSRSLVLRKRHDLSAFSGKSIRKK